MKWKQRTSTHPVLLHEEEKVKRKKYFPVYNSLFARVIFDKKKYFQIACLGLVKQKRSDTRKQSGRIFEIKKLANGSRQKSNITSTKFLSEHPPTRHTTFTKVTKCIP